MTAKQLTTREWALMNFAMMRERALNYLRVGDDLHRKFAREDAAAARRYWAIAHQ